MLARQQVRRQLGVLALSRCQVKAEHRGHDQSVSVAVGDVKARTQRIRQGVNRRH